VLKPAIEVQNVSKLYRTRVGSYRTLREDAYNIVGKLLGKDGIRPDDKRFWALRDVSFSLGPGETLGIIGGNGSGKTTLLRLLAGVTQPTAGTLAVRGKLGTIIELTAGFEGELTGRENIMLNGSIQGMSNRRVREQLDEIIEYSGIREFIDVPFKRYSAGMMVRLGFALAIQTEPDVLLIDEVLAVGDAQFREKSQKRMLDLIGRGCAVVLVSHSMDAVKAICKRGLWIHQGEIRVDGPIYDACHAYHEYVVDKYGPDVVVL